MSVRDRPHGEARGGEKCHRLPLDPLAVLQRASRVVGDGCIRGRLPAGGKAEFRQDFADIAGKRRYPFALGGMG